MMHIWTVEKRTPWGDYGDTHFNVMAETKEEAWKKAVEVEDRKNIAWLRLAK